MGTLLSAFYEKACADHRIGTTHISLYFALLHEFLSRTEDYLLLDKTRLMEKAKIRSRVTYHRCLRALHEYGYIDYVPSFTAFASKMKLIELH